MVLRVTQQSTTNLQTLLQIQDAFIFFVIEGQLPVPVVDKEVVVPFRFLGIHAIHAVSTNKTMNCKLGPLHVNHVVLPLLSVHLESVLH